MPTPDQILSEAYQRATASLDSPLVHDPRIVDRVELVSRNIQNRAGVRLLLACLLAKVHNPNVDIRKPYTKIGDEDVYSGRSYDEEYVAEFVIQHDLPCNTTTAFLTPALRNRNAVLTPAVDLVGRPREVYEAAIQLLNDVHTNLVKAEDLLAETVRWLLVVRQERQQRMDSLLAGLRSIRTDLPLSAEAIITLIEQHLAFRGASRLPVLVVTAAYQAAADYLGEHVLPLESHTAADSQTQALGDVQITLTGENNIVTCYEMKMKRVTIKDIDRALQKIAQSGHRIDNYLFITTEVITDEVAAYAASIYERADGIEVAILDCVNFLRHFLHLFHRLRAQFLDLYQELVLSEPESAVRYPLKEAFLALRQAAESGG